MQEKLIFVFILFYAKAFANVTDQALQAPWTPCTSSDLQNTIQATNVQIFITNCTTNNTRCHLVRGTNASISAVFTPNTGSTTLERTIIARFNKLVRGKPLEIPYGGNVNACADTRLLSDNSTCQTWGLSANQEWKYESTFPVFAHAPKTELEVIFMLRTASQQTTNRRVGSRRWREHPGPIYVCSKIPVSIGD